MLVLPLHRRIDWTRPPVVTLALCLVNVLIFVGVQDQRQSERQHATRYYFQSGLADTELPGYYEYLRERGREEHAERLERASQRRHARALVLYALQADRSFLQALHDGRVIESTQPGYGEWRDQRRHFDRLWGKTTVERYGLTPAVSAPETWLTSMFLHGSSGHLLGNMIFLALIGLLVEAALGALAFLVYYLVGGIAAAAAFVTLHPDLEQPLVGASGAIAGTMGLYAVVFARHRVRVFYTLIVYLDHARVPAWVLLPVWLGHEILQALAHPNSPVAFEAHIGGLMAGALIGLGHTRLGKVDRDYVEQDEREERKAQILQQAREDLAELRVDEAVRPLQALAAERPHDPEVLEQLYKSARYRPDGEAFHAAAKAILQLPGDDPSSLALVHETYGDYIRTARPKPKLAPRLLVQLARRFAQAGYAASAHRLVTALQRQAPELAGLADAALLTARALNSAGQTDNAQALLRKLASAQSDPETAKIARKLLGTEQQHGSAGG